MPQRYEIQQRADHMETALVKRRLESYATAWAVEGVQIERVERKRRWLRTFETHVWVTGNHYQGVAIVSAPKYEVRVFDVRPIHEHPMLPLWAAYPGHPSFWGGWRQGWSESYSLAWGDWIGTLNQGQRESYFTQFPPPKDPELCWKEWLDSLLDAGDAGC